MDGLRAEQLRTLFRWFKEGPPGAVSIEHDGRSLGVLVAVTWEDAGCSAAVGRLAAWHEHALSSFPEPYAVTATGARQWLVERVLETPDRVLFWVRDVRGGAIGHVGLSDLDADGGAITVGDVLCAGGQHQALMGAAVARLREWVQQTLKLAPRRQGEAVAA